MLTSPLPGEIGLDSFERKQLGTILDHLNEQEKTLIIICHDMDFVADHIQKVVCLSQGHEVFDNDAKKLFAAPDIMHQAGLFPPQMARLSAQFSIQPPAQSPNAFSKKLFLNPGA